MDIEQKKENKCASCRYLLRYFTNIDGYFLDLHTGRCINRKITHKESDQRIKQGLPCELWEPDEKQKEERRENIEETLRSMSKRITEIAQILKIDLKED